VLVASKDTLDTPNVDGSSSSIVYQLRLDCLDLAYKISPAVGDLHPQQQWSKYTRQLISMRYRRQLAQRDIGSPFRLDLFAKVIDH
jgi:hypothetical protein